MIVKRKNRYCHLVTNSKIEKTFKEIQFVAFDQRGSIFSPNFYTKKIYFNQSARIVLDDKIYTVSDRRQGTVWQKS